MNGKFGLLGEKLSHSFSPIIHAEFGDYEYHIYEKKLDELETFLKFEDFQGLNVTTPYKKAVIKYCSELSETARAVGNVNTIIRLSNGSLYGDNTDHFGFVYLLRNSGIDPAEGKTVILGNGGSSLTVQSAISGLGSKDVVFVSRNGVHNYNNLQNHDDATILINTTPVGMYPNNGLSPLASLAFFPKCRAVIDLIYNPSRTELLLQAEEQGIENTNGLIMLVAQAKKSAEIFMGMPIPNEKIEFITSKIAKMTQNIVLIGMPGCGKTSIGSALAKRLGRRFADTDDCVEQVAGKSIQAIFIQDGENTFRSLEKDALKTLCKEHSLVIATGGGIVTQPENYRIIRQNSVVVFLDRSVTQLPKSGRPLTERDGINALAAVRMPLYEKWSDFAISVRGIQETVRNIQKQLFGGELP